MCGAHGGRHLRRKRHSNIPVQGGLWEKFDPTVYASIDMFREDPSKYWSIRGEFIRNCEAYAPNPGHLSLAELEAMGRLRHVITQNIDGLHRKAGSRSVTEIHGKRNAHDEDCA